MERTYTVVLLKEEDGGYSVSVPALEGCFTQGDTVEQSLERVQEAIRCYTKGLEKLGEPVLDDVETVVFDMEEAVEALVTKVHVVAVPEAVAVA